MEDFVHIEKTIHNGKALLKINDSSNPQEYIDPIDGKSIQQLNMEKPLTTLSETNKKPEMPFLEKVPQNNLKPEMIATSDNEIINNIQKRLQTMKNSLNFDYLNLPMLINFIQQELSVFKFPLEVESDYLRYLVLWTDRILFSNTSEKMTEEVYRDIAKIYQEIRYRGIPLKPVTDIPFIDDFIINLFKMGVLEKVSNAFDVVLAVVREVNHLPMINYQKKLYVLNVVSKLASKNIFASELECHKLSECIPLYPNFIDTIVYLNKKYHLKLNTIQRSANSLFICCLPYCNEVLYA